MNVNEVSNAFVCLLGMGVVFVGLICIVLLCKLTSMVVIWLERSTTDTDNTITETAAAPSAPNQAHDPNTEVAVSAALAEMLDTDIQNIHISSMQAAANGQDIPNRQELIAAVSAAIAEMLGTDVSGIQVLSFKKTDNHES